jgi:hypothetical protein
VQAIEAQNLAASLVALSDWMRFFPDTSQGAFAPISDAFARIGAARYGRSHSATADAWQEGQAALRDLRSVLRRRADRNGQALPPLNP